MGINSLNCPPQPPDVPADVPQPSSMFTHDQSTPGAAMTQEEKLIKNQQDAETSDVTEDTGTEPSFGRKTMERPILPPALTEGYGDGPGDGTTTKVLASEIPDSDAISPFTSPMKEVRGQEFVGGGEGAGRPVDIAGGGATEVMEAVVKGEESEGKATTNMIVEATMIELPRGSEAPVYAESRPDAESNERDKGDGTSLPIMQISDLQELPIYGPEILPESENISAQQAVLLQDYTRAEDGSSVEGGPEPTSVAIQRAAASKDGGLKDDCGSPTKEVAYPESARSDEVDVVVAENSLPKEKESLLRTALQADVALSLEEVSTPEDTQPTNDLLSTKEVPRTEIPASDDDEDPIDEDTDTSTNIFELHTSHGSSAKYHVTFPTDLQVTKDKDESVLAPSSTARPEPQINGDTHSPKPQHSQMVDKFAPNTEATEPFDVFIPVVEPLLPRISADERISGSLDIDVLEGVPVEGISSTLVGFPTTSANLQYPFQADARNSSGAMDLDLPDVPVSTMEGVRSTPPVQHLGASIILPSSTASAESPKIETTSAKFNDEKLPEIAASSSAIIGHPYQEFLPAEETQASLMSSLVQNADDARTSEISSSPPKFRAGKYASAKLTVTPNASFEAADGSQIKETGSVITLKSPNKRKTSSTAPNESQGHTKRQSIPKKMVDTANASLATLVDPPNNDVLFQELKAMKIASIQARNVSLEAEIATRRAKLEVITQDLENPAAETVKRHIKLLHDYNDIRDVGQGLVGMTADNRGVRIGELYGEFGVGLKD